MVNRIKVIPKRKYEPLFNGYINIIENEWRIQSVQLVLYKENQMQMVDTLRIEQLYVPSGSSWIIKQQTIYPAIRFLGFDITGNFVQVYDKFNLNPVFAKGFFDNTIMKFEDSANKKPLTYWDSVRPVPLLQEEARDYKKKDSLEQARKDPHYMDSLDRIRNKPTVMGLLSTGQVFTQEKSKSSITFPPLLNEIQYNTVEGVVIHIAPTYEKRFSDVKRNRLSMTPHLRYGFSNKHFNPYLSVGYSYGKKYFSNINIAGGKRVFQFDNSNPINSFFNTIATLQYERNWMKIYEANFGRIGYSKEVGRGVIVSADLEYQDRYSLENTTTGKWRDLKDRSFTPNYTLPAHQAVIAGINLRWKPGTKYIQFPERKVSIGSSYPTFNFSYTKGIKNIAGSDFDYSKWRVSINDDINLKLLGQLNYKVTAGGFFDTKSVYLPDYQHFSGNRLTIASPYLNSFQLMPYYAYSNTEKFFTTGHAEYHLNGFLTNKIPIFKKLNWFAVTGANVLYLNNGTTYTEAFVGLENILKIFRVDFVRSFSRDQNDQLQGIRIFASCVCQYPKF